MRENRIFELLLDEKSEYPFCKLNKDSVDVISNKFVSVIYNTLKQKSSASVTKRTNILKFINGICGANEVHLHKESYSHYLEKVISRYKDCNDVKYLLDEINKDLSDLNTKDLAKEILKYNERKDYKLKINKLEFIKKLDQEQVDSHFKNPISVQKKICYYETNANLVNGLLGETITKNVAKKECDRIEFRKNQIKFGYAVINLKVNACVTLLSIFALLRKYEKLESFEVDFILYAFKYCESKMKNYLIDNFPFVYEKTLIKLCKDIILCQDDQQISDYFQELEKNKSYVNLRDLCLENIEFCYIVKSLIYELYSFSFCNENILKFLNLF